MPPRRTWPPLRQMEPVPKAVLGAALGKPRRPVIACSVCQIRFNSEVRPLGPPSNSSGPSPDTGNPLYPPGTPFSTWDAPPRT